MRQDVAPPRVNEQPARKEEPLTDRASDMVICDAVSKSYATPRGRPPVLSNIDLCITRGEFVCLLGPSGCGKTTLLNCIAGLVPIDEGRISVGSRQVLGPGADRGMVFQDHALFPWKTVRANVELGPKLARKPPSDQKGIADHYLRMVGLQGHADLYPSQLSGGMKQRVGIARALANNPEVLLMDEPFGALDALTRAQLQEDLLTIWQQETKTVIFVTHGVQEAIFLADRIVVMSANPGRVQEIVEVGIPRMRDRTSPEFTKVYRHLEALLHGPGGE